MKIIPKDFILRRIPNSKLPPEGVDYILKCYELDSELFSKWFNTAENNSKRKGFGGEEYSLWIAANCVYSIKSSPHAFYCYYCNTDFLANSSDEVEFEHFNPKLQKPENIVFSCSKCNDLKKDHKLDYYENYLSNPSSIKSLRPINKHFIPLVLRHYGATSMHGRFYYINLMKDFAYADFHIELRDSSNRYDIFEQYAALFRNKYYKK